MNDLLKRSCLLLIAGYRTLGTSFIGGSCRFEPSCSEYALCCFQHFNLSKAFILTLKRLLKCRPFGPVGYDPIPLQENSNATK